MHLHTSRSSLPARHWRLIIVGAGLAGLELARQLELAGADDVLVLDAGPAADLRHVNCAEDPDTALRMWLQPEKDPYFHQPWVSHSPPHYATPSGIRQRLGGRSLYWYGVLLPIEDWALSSWPQAVADDLRDRFYPRLMQRLCQESVATSLRVGGLSWHTTPQARSGVDGQRWYAYSPLDAWRDPGTGAVLRRPERITFCTEARVTAVETTGGACTGVVLDDGGRLTGDRVVLAAGTLENSRLALSALDLDRLGGLADHIVQGLFARLGTALPHGSYYAALPHVRSNAFLEIEADFIDLRITGEQVPAPTSYVARDGVHVTPAAEDYALIAMQREILHQIWADLSGSERQLDFGQFDNPLRTNAFVLPETMRSAPYGEPVTWSSFLGIEDHEGGTLPLGRLLNDNHEFFALPGLYAAGPSTFPRLGAANPSLTTLALAHRLAERIAR